MQKNRRLTAEEKHIWQCFTQDIVPVASSCKIKGESVAPKVDIREASISKPVKVAPKYSEDLQPGDMSYISGASVRQLKRNQSRPDATLDLHGYTQAQALEQFQQFLHHASASGHRLLRVITGYGKMSGGEGVLRAALPKWVNYPENRRLILSYQQARAQEGGAGAWLILLRRKERL